jgi:hypothetical protein
MVEQIAGGGLKGLSSSFIVLVGIGAMVVTPLVWLALLLTCSFRRSEPELECGPGRASGEADSRTSSKELALLIVGALEQSNIVSKERFNDAVRIAVDKIQLRKALEDP